MAAAALSLLRCVWILAASCADWMRGPCWLTMTLRYLHARMAALVLGSIFRLVLRSGGEDVTRLFFRRPGVLCLQHCVRGLPRHILVLLWCLVGRRDDQCWRYSPPIKKVDVRQRCDFLFRASLCQYTPGACIVQARWQAHVYRPFRAGIHLWPAVASACRSLSRSPLSRFKVRRSY